MNQTTAADILKRADGKLLNHARTIEEWAQVLDCAPERAQQAIDMLKARGLIREVEDQP